MRKNQLLMRKQAPLLSVNIQRCEHPNWLKSHKKPCNKAESQETAKPISRIWIKILTILKIMDYSTALLFSFRVSTRSTEQYIDPFLSLLFILGHKDLQHNVTPWTSNMCLGVLVNESFKSAIVIWISYSTVQYFTKNKSAEKVIRL